MNIWPIFSHH